MGPAPGKFLIFKGFLMQFKAYWALFAHSAHSAYHQIIGGSLYDYVPPPANTSNFNFLLQCNADAFVKRIPHFLHNELPSFWIIFLYLQPRTSRLRAICYDMLYICKSIVCEEAHAYCMVNYDACEENPTLPSQ